MPLIVVRDSMVLGAAGERGRHSACPGPRSRDVRRTRWRSRPPVPRRTCGSERSPKRPAHETRRIGATRPDPPASADRRQAAAPGVDARTGSPDGIYGAETPRGRRVQRRDDLDIDGVAGEQTFGKLDELSRTPPHACRAAEPHPVLRAGDEDRPRAAEPDGMLGDGLLHDAVVEGAGTLSDSRRGPPRRAEVGRRHQRVVRDVAAGPSPAEFGPFLRAAQMTHEPMANITIDEWRGSSATTASSGSARR